MGGVPVSEKDRTDKPNEQDNRLTDSESILSVTIDGKFGNKTLSCKATVPADTTGISDSVLIISSGGK